MIAIESNERKGAVKCRPIIIMNMYVIIPRVPTRQRAALIIEADTASEAGKAANIEHNFQYPLRVMNTDGTVAIDYFYTIEKEEG